MRILPALATGLMVAIAMPAFAKTNVGAEADQLQTMLDELRALIDKGERERLADPWYLRDLKDLVGRYDWPWRNRVLSDDFSGRGPQPELPWRVTAGAFLIDWRFGLRSVVERPAEPAPQPKPQRSQGQSQDEQVGQLLGALLQSALGAKQPQQRQQQQPAGPSAPAHAAIVAALPITNAFAIEVEITNRALAGTTGGRLELGPYQGAAAVAGYRLVYNPGAVAGTPALELVGRSGRGGSSMLDLTDQPINLADGQVHTLLWTRDGGGMMVVSVDGRELIRVTDRSFRDGFDGLVIVNRGGDYAFRRVRIDGSGAKGASTMSDHVEAPLRYIGDTGEKALVYMGAPGEEEVRTAPYASHAMRIHDGRPIAGETTLDGEGFVFRRHRTAVRDFYDDAKVKTTYYPEMERFVKQVTGAEKVFVFDHNTRMGGGDLKPGAERPVQAAHNDYTEKSGPQRVRDLLPADEAETWLKGRFAIINVWRPIRGPVETTPLAVCDARSLGPDDLVTTHLVYKDRIGQTLGVAHNPDHRWYYFPAMAREEALLIKSYDSATDGRARFTPHTAFDDPAAPAEGAVRESIEIRALVFFGA